MTIAFDIDDTITRHPAFFALVSNALVQAGHRVLILTARDNRPNTEADLRRWGIAYDLLVCWSMDTHDLADIDTWKAAECRRHGVEVFFEDDPDVLAHIAPATICFTPFGSVSKIKKWNLLRTG